MHIEQHRALMSYFLGCVSVIVLLHRVESLLCGPFESMITCLWSWHADFARLFDVWIAISRHYEIIDQSIAIGAFMAPITKWGTPRLTRFWIVGACCCWAASCSRQSWLSKLKTRLNLLDRCLPFYIQSEIVGEAVAFRASTNVWTVFSDACLVNWH